MNATQLISRLTQTVGEKYIITDPAKTEQYRQGYRFGEGKALAVVRPGTVLEMWQILQACVEADVIVITQAANTGLTGGSTPDGNDYDRDIVIVNTMRLNIIQPINNNEQVVCLPGSTLNQLELLLKPLGREPHSVIGSSCIGASVLAAYVITPAALWYSVARLIRKWPCLRKSTMRANWSWSTIWA